MSICQYRGRVMIGLLFPFLLLQGCQAQLNMTEEGDPKEVTESPGLLQLLPEAQQLQVARAPDRTAAQQDQASLVRPAKRQKTGEGALMSPVSLATSHTTGLLYDVFISHAGAQKHHIAMHVYNNIKEKNSHIHVFLDEKELPLPSINPALQVLNNR